MINFETYPKILRIAVKTDWVPDLGERFVVEIPNNTFLVGEVHKIESVYQDNIEVIILSIKLLQVIMKGGKTSLDDLHIFRF